MEINTKSGVEYCNKRSPYAKFLSGYIASGAWSGWYTLRCAAEYMKDKPDGCSWYAYGYLIGKLKFS